MTDNNNDVTAGQDPQEYTLREVAPNELPLSTRDETPPLLLDLPEGQQLVVGKLPDGIVIEIATWRGTGRPDSRTNRMMLGVSYDEDVIEETKKKSFFEKIKRNNEAQQEVQVAPATEVAPTAAVTQVEATPEVLPSEAPAPTPLEIPTETPVDLAPAGTPIHIEAIEELEELEGENVRLIPHLEPELPQMNLQRNMQDLFGARPRAQVVTETGESNSRLNKHAHEIVKRDRGNVKFDGIGKTLAKTLAWVAGFVLLVFLAAGPGQLRIVHPDLGLQTSLSSAKDALIIVKKSDAYIVGDNVVVESEAQTKDKVFGSVAAVSDSEYIVTENNLYHSALKQNVFGKVVLVMPGLGKIFSIFN
jgi:hypothetical protein